MGWIIDRVAGEGPESIVEIGPRIKIRVVETLGQKVILSIESPEGMPPHKLDERIKELRSRRRGG